MSELDKILLKLKRQKAILRRKFKIKSLGVFGSYSRGEQRKTSDVDVLVEFDEPPGLIGYVSLEDELGKYIGKKVDLVMKSALKPHVGQQILREVIYI
ncbi:MAG: nucleotidyltransferase [Elusimicrobia bacterium RIFOXYB2_FULL_50_12]|nr:MAG: nucleotidyltransferase [Elusimicrobia bacterium RIFOXYB2_FULL_50_12]